MNSKSVEERRESAYLLGNRAAWCKVLSECFLALGYDNPDIEHVKWIAEREEAIAQLRTICGEYGDNDWDNNLHLADILEKHLYKHLEAE